MAERDSCHFSVNICLVETCLGEGRYITFINNLSRVFVPRESGESFVAYCGSCFVLLGLGVRDLNRVVDESVSHGAEVIIFNRRCGTAAGKVVDDAKR